MNDLTSQKQTEIEIEINLQNNNTTKNSNFDNSSSSLNDTASSKYDLYPFSRIYHET